MKKLNSSNTYFFILFSLFILIGLFLSYSIKDWVKENILLPIYEPLLWLYVLFESLPQTVLWVFFLMIGTLYVLKSIIVGLTDISLPKRKTKQAKASDYFLGISNLIDDEQNPYTQQRFAKHLVGLYFEISGKKQYNFRQMSEALHLVKNKIPGEVMEVFKYGLNHSRDLTDIPSQDKFEKTIEFVEHQLPMDY